MRPDRHVRRQAEERVRGGEGAASAMQVPRMALEYERRAFTPRERHFLALKRLFDIAGAVSALVLLGPLFLLVAIAIRLDSRGPVFFLQERIGKDLRRFRMIKFRTMAHGCDLSQHRDFFEKFVNGGSGGVDGKGRKIRKLTGDPRVTRVGQVLRRTSLDELPQLFNILRGEMSFVGPRPPIPYELQYYRTGHLGRFHLRPGLTGAWQVYGRSKVSFEGMIAMDLDYVRRCSLLYDLRLILLSVPVILSGDGAY